MAPVIKVQTPPPTSLDGGFCSLIAAWDPGFGSVSILSACCGLVLTAFVVVQVCRSSCWRSPSAKLAACQAVPLVAIALTFPISCALAGSTGNFGIFGTGALADTR